MQANHRMTMFKPPGTELEPFEKEFNDMLDSFEIDQTFLQDSEDSADKQKPTQSLCGSVSLQARMQQSRQAFDLQEFVHSVSVPPVQAQILASGKAWKSHDATEVGDGASSRPQAQGAPQQQQQQQQQQRQEGALNDEDQGVSTPRHGNTTSARDMDQANLVVDSLTKQLCPDDTPTRQGAQEITATPALMRSFGRAAVPDSQKSKESPQEAAPAPGAHITTAPTPVSGAKAIGKSFPEFMPATQLEMSPPVVPPFAPAALPTSPSTRPQASPGPPREKDKGGRLLSPLGAISAMFKRGGSDQKKPLSGQRPLPTRRAPTAGVRGGPSAQAVETAATRDPRLRRQRVGPNTRAVTIPEEVAPVLPATQVIVYEAEPANEEAQAEAQRKGPSAENRKVPVGPSQLTHISPTPEDEIAASPVAAVAFESRAEPQHKGNAEEEEEEQQRQKQSDEGDEMAAALPALVPQTQDPRIMLDTQVEEFADALEDVEGEEQGVAMDVDEQAGCAGDGGRAGKAKKKETVDRPPDMSAPAARTRSKKRTLEQLSGGVPGINGVVRLRRKAGSKPTRIVQQEYLPAAPEEPQAPAPVAPAPPAAKKKTVPSPSPVKRPAPKVASVQKAAPEQKAAALPQPAPAPTPAVLAPMQNGTSSVLAGIPRRVVPPAILAVRERLQRQFKEKQKEEEAKRRLSVPAAAPTSAPSPRPLHPLLIPQQPQQQQQQHQQVPSPVSVTQSGTNPLLQRILNNPRYAGQVYQVGQIQPQPQLPPAAHGAPQYPGAGPMPGAHPAMYYYQ